MGTEVEVKTACGIGFGDDVSVSKRIIGVSVGIVFGLGTQEIRSKRRRIIEKFFISLKNAA
jgi:hypothetical protein